MFLNIDLKILNKMLNGLTQSIKGTYIRATWNLPWEYIAEADSVLEIQPL